MPESPGVFIPGDLAQGLCQFDFVDVDIRAFKDSSEQQQQAVYPKRAFVASPLRIDPSEQPFSGTAQRRRQRRLRSWLRHERMTVAMVLAERTRHSSRGKTIARAGVWGHEMNHPATIRHPATPQLELLELSFEEEPGGRGLGLSRPLCRRAGLCGTPWTRSSMPCRGYRLSMFLCRR